MSATANGDRILIVRLSSLGDLVHALPVIPAIRGGLPGVTLDWFVDSRWAPLMSLVEGIDEVVQLNRSISQRLACVHYLRQRGYSCALDLQGNYRSGLLTWLSGAPRRVGRHRSAARQPGASRFYTEAVIPNGQHITEMSLDLAEHAGARRTTAMQFPLRVPPEELRYISNKLGHLEISEYVVICLGGGWKSKCWPPERFGALAAEMWRRHRIRAVFNIGPGEEPLGEAAVRAAGAAKPVVLCPPLRELAALLSNAMVVVAADTGPLHLAAALGTRVVGLFGPTNPSRNGPLPHGTVLQNALPEAHNHHRGNYTRGAEYSASMLSLTVDQVSTAVEEELAAMRFSGPCARGSVND